MRRRPFARGALVAAIVLAFLPATSHAAVKDCPASTNRDGGRLPHVTVTSVRNMECRTALNVAAARGRTPKNALGKAGSRFTLGRWSCAVTYHNYELWKARCTLGTRAFRVSYGF